MKKLSKRNKNFKSFFFLLNFFIFYFNFNRVEREISTSKSTGLEGVLSTIKKKKLTTLQKSQLDWHQYKQEAQIEEDLALEAAKGGHLDKEDFLLRTDWRQVIKIVVFY